MNLIGRLRTIAELYCASADIRREQLSYQIFRDQRRLGNVFAGEGGLTIASYENAMLWLAANWPAGAEWPDGIERPDVPAAVAE